MKKVIFAAVLGLVAATLAIAPAQADTCVSSKEFGKIKNGMTESQVKTLTGTNGTVFTSAGSGKYKIVIRNYKACSKFGAVSIGYMGGKVNSKSGIF
jgi:hypothetical protein